MEIPPPPAPGSAPPLSPALALGPRDLWGWILRGAALFWCGGILLGTLGYRDYRSLWSGLTLGIHELGHMVMGPLGDWAGMAGGSLFQVAAPLTATLLLHRQGDPVGASVGLVWLGTALVEMGSYVADARARVLDLVSPFAGEPIHDWEWMLGKMGLLQYDTLLGEACRFGGIVVMAGALFLGVHALLVTRPGQPQSTLDRSSGVRPR